MAPREPGETRCRTPSEVRRSAKVQEMGEDTCLSQEKQSYVLKLLNLFK